VDTRPNAKELFFTPNKKKKLISQMKIAFLKRIPRVALHAMPQNSSATIRLAIFQVDLGFPMQLSPREIKKALFQ
jgi:hypothetical protein